MTLRYGCMLFCAVWILVWVEVVVMSSAYVMMFGVWVCVVDIWVGIGVGISALYMLKSVGERTPPWGAPVLMSF